MSDEGLALFSKAQDLGYELSQVIAEKEVHVGGMAICLLVSALCETCSTNAREMLLDGLRKVIETYEGELQ